MEQYLHLALPVIGLILGLMLTWLTGLAIRKFKLNELEGESLKALASAVTSTYNNYVKDFKLNQKGKLSETQKIMARNEAKRVAGKLLTGPAREFFGTIWDERKDQIIESLVTKFKGKAKS
ncbi:MAG: hypothetical protein COA79_23100 [Planctomycetota bacterium]|nr:MAG: hypothetical protein COA79_23100 [Planctomycetota bacterium]